MKTNKWYYSKERNTYVMIRKQQNSYYICEIYLDRNPIHIGEYEYKSMEIVLDVIENDYNDLIEKNPIIN